MNILKRDTPPPYSNEFKRTATAEELIAKGMLLGKHIVDEWEEGGHLFRVDKIDPKKIGATMRNYELFCDGDPAYGGRLHHTVEAARERASFVAQGSMSEQITYLWGLVDKLRNKLGQYEKE